MIRFREETGEQPGIASEMLGSGRAPADSIGPRIREAGPCRFLIAARGGSDHAALVFTEITHAHLFETKEEPEKGAALPARRSVIVLIGAALLVGLE